MATFVRRGANWNAQVARRGVRRSATFATKREAQDWARSVEAEIVGGTASKVVPTVGIPEPHSSKLDKDTVGSLIDRYIATLRPVKRWGRTKDFSLAAIKARLGELNVINLTSDVLVEYAQERAAEGAGPVTIQMDMAYIGNVLKVARVVWKLPIPRDLVADAREALKLLGLVGKSRQRSRVAKPGELEAVRSHWQSAVPFAIVHFAVASCMRLSEITALMRSDRDGSTILVRDRKHPTEKHGNDQVVPLLGDAAAILDGLPYGGERYFPYPSDTVGAAWQRACKRAGVRDLHFHDLRHTGLTLLRKRGLGIPELAVVSGHRDWKMLQRYVNITAADLLSPQ